MLNRYFKVDGNNSLDFMYANMAVKNIYFALISLDYIFDPDKYNVGVYHDEHAYYFFHIQSLLTACGNISNIFYNPNGYNGRRSTERCRRLRDMLGIKKTDYPLIFQKEMRNTNEHFDERYEEFGGNLGDYNLLDNNTDPYMRAVIKANPHLRTYDKENHIYYTFVCSKGEFKRAEYNLDELQSELEKMMHRISENSLFDSAWVTEISTEGVE